MINIATEKTEIEKSIKRIEHAENRKDMEALLEELTEDCIYIVNGAPNIQGRVAWKKFYGKSFETRISGSSGSLSSLGIEISSSGDMAWDHGVFVSEYEGPDGHYKAEGKYLAVYKKVDGQWKTAAVCTTGNG
jgi:uncharacterized protein (TIGR02246 family)